MSAWQIVGFLIVLAAAIIALWVTDKVSDRLAERVDEVPGPKGRTFSPRRTGRLLVAILGAGILGGIPLLIIQGWVASQEADTQEKATQRELRQVEDRVRKAVREGKAGEAFQRLFPEEHQEFLRRKRASERAADTVRKDAGPIEGKEAR